MYRPPVPESFQSEDEWFLDRIAMEYGLFPLQNIHHVRKLWLSWSEEDDYVVRIRDVPQHIRQHVQRFTAEEEAARDEHKHELAGERELSHDAEFSRDAQSSHERELSDEREFTDQRDIPDVCDERDNTGARLSTSPHSQRTSQQRASGSPIMIPSDSPSEDSSEAGSEAEEEIREEAGSQLHEEIGDDVGEEQQEEAIFTPVARPSTPPPPLQHDTHDPAAPSTLSSVRRPGAVLAIRSRRRTRRTHVVLWPEPPHKHPNGHTYPPSPLLRKAETEAQRRVRIFFATLRKTISRQAHCARL